MEYISVRKAAQKWGFTVRMINYYCAGERVEGAQSTSNVWLIPDDAVKPKYRRKGNERKSTACNKENGQNGQNGERDI